MAHRFKITLSVIIFVIVTINIGIFCLVSSSADALSNQFSHSEGYYISHALGQDNIIEWEYFKPGGVKLPSGTSLSYQFAGSKNNYQSWTDLQSTDDKIDLSSLTQLKDSKYLKVRINFSSNSSETPSLKDYTLLVKVPANSGQVIGSIPPPEGQPVPQPVSAGAEKIIQNIKTTNGNEVQITQLVSTGSFLWFNLLIAVILGIFISILLLKISRRSEINSKNINTHAIAFNTRKRIIFSIIIFIVIIILAILIWAIKTEKIAMFASEKEQTALIIVSGRGNWDLGEFNNVMVSPLDNSIYLNISIIPPVPTCTLSLSSSSLSINEGDETSLTAALSNVSGGSVEQVTFSSSDSSIATVSPISDTNEPYLTTIGGLAAGSTTIIAEGIMSGSSRCSAAVEVTVTSISAYFEFTDEANTFIIKLDDPVKIEQARDILSGEITDTIHVMGTIIKQSAPYNSPWNYYLNPSSISFFENATKVCDANIQYVEDHLDEVGGSTLPNNQWCPWHSRLIKEAGPEAYLSLSTNNASEADIVSIDSKLNNYTKNYEEPFINIQFSDKAWLFSNYSFFPLKIMPFSLPPGNYNVASSIQTLSEYGEVETYYSPNKDLTITSSGLDPNCNLNKTECTLGRVETIYEQGSDATALQTKLAYIQIPKVYEKLHGTSVTIENEPLFNEIRIKDDCYIFYAIAIGHMLSRDGLRPPDQYPGFSWCSYQYIDFTTATKLERFIDLYAMPGVSAHELAHALKISKYEFNYSLIWIEEGSADWVKYRLDYNVDNEYCPVGQTYLDGYDCASSFFKFIDEKYNTEVVRKYVEMLEIAPNENDYEYNLFTTKLFDNYVGKNVNTLWNEYLAEHQ